MKKKVGFILILISIFIIIGAFLVTSYGKDASSIEKKLQGVRISKDSLIVIENVTATIKGHLYKNSDGFTFSGRLNISSLDFSDCNDSVLIYINSFPKKSSVGRGIINYPRNIMSNGKIYPDFATIQSVYTDSNLSYLIMSNYDDDCINNSLEDSVKVFRGNDIIVFPATDAESALTLINELQINQDIFSITTRGDFEQ